MGATPNSASASRRSRTALNNCLILLLPLLPIYNFVPSNIVVVSGMEPEASNCSVADAYATCGTLHALLHFAPSRNISALRLICTSESESRANDPDAAERALKLLTEAPHFRTLRNLSLVRCGPDAAHFAGLPQLDVLDLRESGLTRLPWPAIGSAHMSALHISTALDCADCRNAWLRRVNVTNATAWPHPIFPRLPQHIHMPPELFSACTFAHCAAESAALDRGALARAHLGAPLQLTCRFRTRNGDLENDSARRPIFTWPFSEAESDASLNETLTPDGTLAMLNIDALRTRHLGIVACRCWHCDTPTFDTAELRFRTPLSLQVIDAGDTHTLAVHGYPQDALRLHLTRLGDADTDGNWTEQYALDDHATGTQTLFNGTLLVRPEHAHSLFFLRYLTLALHECSDCTHTQAGGTFRIEACRNAGQPEAEECAAPVQYALHPPRHPTANGTRHLMSSASGPAFSPHFVLFLLLAALAFALLAAGARAAFRLRQRMQLRQKLKRRSARRVSRNTQRTEETSIPLDTLSRSLSLSAHYMCMPPAHVPVLDSRELQLQQRIGKGAFGEVYAALWKSAPLENGTTTTVAQPEEQQQMLNNGTEPNRRPRRVAVKLLVGVRMDEELEREAGLLARLQHPHVLRMFGLAQIASDNGEACVPQVALVMELMSLGDLRNYLRARAPRGDAYAQFPPALAHAESVNICVQVADGLCYLVQQQIVHRDLAARNCLVTGESDARCCSAAFRPPATVKIADFGMSRRLFASGDYYRMQTKKAGGAGTALPVRWMPPECLGSAGKYTHQSDMWSFGVLLFEVFSFGEQPFGALSNGEVLSAVLGGMRPEVPERCAPPLAALMRACWHRNAAKRVQAEEALARLRAIAEEPGGAG